MNTTGEETTYGLSTAEDGVGHGTFVTGIAAAGDDTGPVGVSRGVDLYAVKVLDSDRGKLSDLVEGIDAIVASREPVTSDDLVAAIQHYDTGATVPARTSRSRSKTSST